MAAADPVPTDARERRDVVVPVPGPEDPPERAWLVLPHRHPVPTLLDETRDAVVGLAETLAAVLPVTVLAHPRDVGAAREHVARALQCGGPGIGEELAHFGARWEGIGGVPTAAGPPIVEIIVGGGDDGAVDVEAPVRWLLRAVDSACTGRIRIEDRDIDGDAGALDEFLYGPETARTASDDGNASGRLSGSHCAVPSMRAASSEGEMSKFSHTQESL